jgi:hypothetical protein
MGKLLVKKNSRPWTSVRPKWQLAYVGIDTVFVLLLVPAEYYTIG